MTKYEKQIKIEQDAYDYSYRKFLNELTKRIQFDKGHELAEGKLLIKYSIDAIADKLIEYFNTPLKGSKNTTRSYLEDYFDRPHDLALILLNTIISSVSKDGKVKAIMLSHRINSNIYKNYIFMQLKKQHPKLYSYIDREYKKRGEAYITSRKRKLGKMKAELNESLMGSNATKLGIQLIDIVLKSGVNLLTRVTIRDKGNNTAIYLQYTEEAFNLILKNREHQLLNYRKYPILIIPPVDWQGFDGNLGYYNEKLYKGTVIKARGKNKKVLRQYLEHKPLTRYLDIINTIQQTKWRINKRVYNIIDYIMKENIVDYESPRNNPYLIGGLPYNRQQKPEDYVDVYTYGEVYAEGKYSGMPKDRQAYKKWYADIERQKEKIIVNNGKAIVYNLALNDAKYYLDEPEIYFSYQSDFRGRIYPIQQHLHPQSRGDIKALLEFADGVPIENSEQLYWFKIHGANTYGMDKELYKDRVAFIDSIEDKIIAIANDPIRNRDEWKDADEPFLFLAWCFEYRDYKHSPNTFLSHLPISLDATCSGIQIYSGLLLDEDGAEAVNVINKYSEHDGTPIRADIYQKVADKVNNYLSIGDYENEIMFKKSDGTINICPTITEAVSMRGKVSRSLVKRNVMTQPYSVTTYGMYQQLIEILDEMEDKNNIIWKGDKWVLARLLTQLNDRAIVDTVKGARIGQEFLKEVTKYVTNSGNYIFYTTPILEFPVLQKIHKVKTRQIRTEIGFLNIVRELDTINNIKMINGIAPNFIHSLDFTLMFLTVEKLIANGCKSYHLIHDSYGVPINQVTNLNKAIRESYVELFTAKPLERFTNQVCKELTDKGKDIMINTLDLNQVYDSDYIFS